MRREILIFGEYKNGVYFEMDSYEWEKYTNKAIHWGQIGDDTSSIDLVMKNISHEIKNIEINEDGIYGDVIILNTEKGRLLNNILQQSGAYSFTVNCTGSIQDDGKVLIKHLTSFDIVPISLTELRSNKIKKIKKRINENNKNI
jgi:hypothetical protein